ncbi:MAG TPA: hypothetical protein VI958_10875, partial [Acidobacteriota bacterium]
MKQITVVISIALICSMALSSCAKKQKPIEPPAEPTVAQPPAPLPEAPPPGPSPEPPPTRKPLEAKPLKPRAQATGDPTALKLVQRG